MKKKTKSVLECKHNTQHLYWCCDDCKKVGQQVTELDLALCGYRPANIEEVNRFIKNENIKEIIKPKKAKFKLPETKSVVRRETGLLEWICEHGVGHPLTSSAIKLAKKHKHNLSSWLIHGCDGCCNSEEFKKIDKNYTETR